MKDKTNEELKAEAIAKAYGEYWEIVKNNLITDSEWFKSKEILGDFANSTIRRKYPNIEWECMDNYHPIYCYYFRPKSLSGIENNNGWIRILHDVSELPTEQVWIRIQNEDFYIGFLFNDFGFFVANTATHYQPIIKPKPPIF